MNYDGRVMAGGILYGDNYGALIEGAKSMRKSAWSVIKSAQQDTDPGYRLMGAMVALQCRATARALRERADKILRDQTF